MNMKRLIRDIHHWGSIVIAVPLLIVIGAGVLLMLKKQIDWIQPPSQRGVGVAILENGSPDAQPLSVLFTAAQSAKPDAFASWDKVSRVDIKPGRDIVKFISEDNWEVQVDLANGQVLQTAYRRSDVIESIHDGSFFAEKAKLFLFLPAALVLFVLWLTGLYMFFLPYWKRWQKARLKSGQ